MNFNTFLLVMLLVISITLTFMTIIINKKIKILIQKLEDTTEEIIDEDKDIVVLNDEKYFYYVLNLIKSAKKEIDIIMFSMFRCKQTEELLNALIEARKRGVMVRIILNKEVESNKEVKNYLASERISVKYSKTRVHNKLVIVDDTVVVGSHNWTDSGLFENRESSIAIRDKNVLKKEKEYFEALWERL
ncbi:phospholipase D-like domain-containing protein [Methanotorris igneus]|uniref:Phospholipase D/Transphosphatidylase n=1 Tax=Methanotorris igneus (strain DSM 5666 / JCM 11834 / Kol 5) TaxID=880724 RepID=F6BE06_METIK|nr:phospholipase D-like domain-containing protein [Methanotorris igneus]AEF96717.1 phospholipase D/Transphosphatidylase [Methanotorris igneus Kol 5]